jgi:hypothetical protein
MNFVALFCANSFKDRRSVFFNYLIIEDFDELNFWLISCEVHILQFVEIEGFLKFSVEYIVSILGTNTIRSVILT